MPVSVVSTKSVNNVNAALRESLGRVAIVSNRTNNNNNNNILVAKVTIGTNKQQQQQQQKLNNANDGCTTQDIDNGNDDDNNNNSNNNFDDTLNCKLTTNARRAQLNELEFEENQIGALDKHKSRYIIFKKITNNNNNSNNGRTLSNNNSNNNNNKQNNKKSLNGNTMELELPKPRHVLYSRNKIMVGWRQNSRRWTVGTGFTNVGNTCYLNSTLQALLHVPAMANWLSMEADNGHLYNCKDSEGGCMICAMIKTMIESQTSTVTAIRPHHIYTRLKTICKTMMIGRQEDAHEFLRHLLESMERSYLSRVRETYPNLDQRSKETTPLNQIFGGYLRSAVRCLNCAHVSVTFQHFQEILLDIGNAESIDHAIEAFFAQEHIEGMCYKCESCKRKVHATKQFSMERAPPVLCIQLKRFNMHGVKLGKTISLKTHLDITKFATNKYSDQLTYKLVAMITHLGHSPNCGHYTAVGLTASGSYYSFDDTYGRAITENSLINTNAYVIFYEMDMETANKQLVDDEMEVARANLRTFISSKITHENVKKTPLVKQNGSAHVAGKFIGPELPKGGLPTTKALHLVNGKTDNDTVKQEADSSTAKTLKEFYVSFLPNSDEDDDAKTAATTTTQTSIAIASNNKQKSLVPYDDNNSLNSESDTEQNATTTTTKTPNSSALKRRLSFSDDDENKIQHKVQPPLTKIINNNNNNNNKSKIQGYEQLNNGLNLAGKKLQNINNNNNKINTANNNNNNNNTTTTTTTTTVTTINTITTTTTSTSNKANNCEEIKTESNDKIFANSNLINNNHNNNNNNSNVLLSTTAITTTTINNNKTNGLHKTPTTTPTTTNNNNNTTSMIKSTLNANNNNNNNNNSKNLHQSPKSPRVINTTTGLWHVTKVALTTPTTPPSPQTAATITTTTTNNEENNNNHKSKLVKETTSDIKDTDTDVTNSRTMPATTTTTTTTATTIASFTIKKNPKNPFARDISNNSNNNNNNNMRRANNNVSSKSSTNTTVNGTDNAVVNKLLKQSHRGYGVPVQSWNGTQSQIDIELENEKKEQRQREWEEDEENEMDRGRQKKTTGGSQQHKNRHNNLTPGYNPFQEQDNMRRWRNPRFFGSNQLSRTHIRNRFKYQNMSMFKFQRSHSANSVTSLLRESLPLTTPISKNNTTVNNKQNNNNNNGTIEQHDTQNS